MSLDLKVYTKQISNDLVPKIVARLNDFDMDCEVHPDFSFSDQTGFLPFKFKLTKTKFQALKDKVLYSGFELYIEDFNLVEEKENLNPKQGFFTKLFSKKQIEQPFASPEIENKLKDFKKVLIFVWHAGDSFQFRFASLTSAIVTELTNGVCSYPADDIWYDNKTIVTEAWKEVREYESGLKENELEFMEFDGWK